MDEWEKARLAAIAQVQRERIDKEHLQRLNILKSSLYKGQRFILSTVSEKERIKRYFQQDFWMTMLFFVAGCAIVWIMNIRLGQPV